MSVGDEVPAGPGASRGGLVTSISARCSSTAAVAKKTTASFRDALFCMPPTGSSGLSWRWHLRPRVHAAWVGHPDGETDRRSRRRGRAAGIPARTIRVPPVSSIWIRPGDRHQPRVIQRAGPGRRPCPGTPRRSRPPQPRPPGRRRMRLPGALIFLFRHHAERREVRGERALTRLIMDDGHRLAELPLLRADLGDRGGYGVRSGEWSARSLRKYRSRTWWHRWLRVSWLAPECGNADQATGQSRLARETSAVMRNTGGG